MEQIMMFYRINAERRAQNPGHRLSEWNYMLVNENVSEKTDGKTFDLIRTYRDNPNGTWEVHLVPVYLPA